jgi:hypothetical protein
MIFLATIPSSNNKAAEVNTSNNCFAFSQNPDSESQNSGGRSGGGGGGGNGVKNVDMSESTARVMLHICISLLREETISSQPSGGGGGWLTEVPMFFTVVSILSSLVGISLDPNNQNMGKEVDANFVGKHLDLIIQVL